MQYVRGNRQMKEKIIDIEAVLEAKAPSLKKRLPNFLISYLKRIAHEDELNDFFSRHWHDDGITFVSSFLDELEISYSIEGKEKLPDDGRKTFVCNHALGGLDGVVLLKILCYRYGAAKVVVNDVLMYISPMKSLFIPVDLINQVQNKETANQIDSCMSSNVPILYFPAGKVSRRDSEWNISDLEWKKNFLTKSIEHERDIVPLFFDGRNSKFFYNLAYWRLKLGIRQNIEQLYLADEMYRNRGNHFRIIVGDTIRLDDLDDAHSVENVRWIRKKCYALSNKRV